MKTNKKNEYVTDDISHLISTTILKYVNESVEKNKYTIKEISQIFDSVNVMDFYFVNGYAQTENSNDKKYKIDSTRFYKIVEELSKHRKNFTLEEYSGFIQSLGHPEAVIQIKGEIDLNSYVFLIEQVINQGEEKFVNFVKLINEIYGKYRSRNLPKYEEWKDLVIDKNNKFELPASLLLPMIVESYSEKSPYSQSDVQWVKDVDLSF